MQTVNVHEAKTHFSGLRSRISASEEIIIAKAGKSAARLMPWREPVSRREPGGEQSTLQVTRCAF